MWHVRPEAKSATAIYITDCAFLLFVSVCLLASTLLDLVCVCERERELDCLCVCAVCAMSLFSQEPSLVRLSRLIYGPAGGACHNFLNLKSQPHPPISRSTLAGAHCTTCSYVKTCAQPLCLYNVPSACVCLPSALNVCHVYTRQSLHVLSLYLCESVKRVCVCVGV